MCNKLHSQTNSKFLNMGGNASIPHPSWPLTYSSPPTPPSLVGTPAAHSGSGHSRKTAAHAAPSPAHGAAVAGACASAIGAPVPREPGTPAGSATAVAATSTSTPPGAKRQSYRSTRRNRVSRRGRKVVPSTTVRFLLPPSETFHIHFFHLILVLQGEREVLILTQSGKK